MGDRHDLDEINTPLGYDIICRQGNKPQGIEGNRCFNDVIAAHKERYQQAEIKSVKN